MTITPDYQRDWPAYFDAVSTQPPRDTLLRALAAMVAVDGVPAVAIDLACGEGRDTRAMLSHPVGLRVFAVDNSEDALRRLLAKLSLADSPRVTAVRLSLEDVPVQKSVLPARATLINASFALPFCHEGSFPSLWKWIVDTLHPGGLFAGQIFGDRDEWAAVNPRRHMTRDQTLALLRPFDIIHFEEVEKTGSDALMRTKQHHLFHIVVRKR